MMGAGYAAKRRVNMDDVQTYDPFNEGATFEYATSIIPRRCYNTGCWIWGTAVRGRRRYRVELGFLDEDRWYHRHEAIIMMLKGLEHGTI